MKKRIIFLIIIVALLLPAASLKAAITTVTLTPASPTTLSNGNAYFLAGVQYTFRVQAVDVAATGKAYWNQIRIQFLSGTEDIIIDVGPDTVNTITGLEIVSITDNNIVSGNPYTNLDYTIVFRFRWDAVEYAVGLNTVRATVTNDLNLPAGGLQDNRSVNHGVCSTIRVVNFAQSGVAADGYVNPWYTTFNVTGAIVYNVTGATVADRVQARDAGEITNTTLFRDGATTGLTDITMADDCTFAEPAGTGVLAFGNHTWDIRVTMQTAGGPETSANTLTFNCDRIRIDAISFINGGGVNAPYYRSVNLPGTQIQITASRESGAPGGMVGDTTITVRNNTDGANFNVQILSGQTIGVANVTTPIVGDVPNGTTQLTDYQIIAISGSSYDNEQNAQNRILTPGDGGVIANSPAYDIQVYWDRNDPPGNNGAPGVGQTPFTAEASFGYTVTATSVTFNWQPVSALPDPPYDGDFDTYRIYYKATLSPTWKIIDRSTPTYGFLNNPATATATIIGLQPLTNYDYFMTAVDVFGQEVEHPIPSGGLSDALYVGAPTPAGYGQFTTNPTSVEATVTDGITNYTFAQFSASINATTRPLRKSSLRVTIFIISAGDQPDSVNLILAQDDGAGNGLPVGNLYPIATAPLYERISCAKSAPNTWQGYIPSTNQFLTEGNYCRFIIESIRNSIPTYSDVTNNGDANDHEYNFLIQTPTKFTPWPTRVLNNVITDKNPLCYPSYYLSDDAYVTIKAYDVKGRPVATLLENGFRKGGQNIKEGGWSGDNKARRKLGVGLYYLRFEAKRARDGKMILNETEKVVMAK